MPETDPCGLRISLQLGRLGVPCWKLSVVPFFGAQPFSPTILAKTTGSEQNGTTTQNGSTSLLKMFEYWHLVGLRTQMLLLSVFWCAESFTLPNATTIAVIYVACSLAVAAAFVAVHSVWCDPLTDDLHRCRWRSDGPLNLYCGWNLTPLNWLLSKLVKCGLHCCIDWTSLNEPGFTGISGVSCCQLFNTLHAKHG